MHALDGLRGVAAAVVLVSHGTAMMLGAPIAPRKYLAVHFFWMLSGFVIAHAYQPRLNSGMTLATYLRCRAVRLYPLIIIAALLGAVVLSLTSWRFVWSDPNAVAAMVAAMLGLPIAQQVFSSGNFPINPPEWSLFWELIMSALFGLVIYKMPTRAIACLAGAGFTAYSTALAWQQTNDLPLVVQGAPAMAAFAGGIMLHRLQHILPTPPMPIWITIAVLIGVAALPLSWGWWYDPACMLLVFPAIILCGARSPVSGPIVRTLGDVSYPLYILHWPVLVACNAVLLPRIGAGPALLFASVVSAVAAYAALRWYDVPVRAALDRSFRSAPKRCRGVGTL